MKDTLVEFDASGIVSTLIYLVAVALFIPALLWQGWAASTLWAWFVTPLGLPAITTGQAAGIILTISAFKFKISAPKNSLSVGMMLFGIVAGPPLVVSIGWCVKAIAG